MNAQNREQPGMEMEENEYANFAPNFAPPEQSTTRVRNNEKLETMIRETNRRVQSNRKLMWLSLIFLLLSFIGGFVALYFSISAKVEMETRCAMSANYLSRLTTTNSIESVQTSLKALKGQLERNLSSLSSDLQSLKQQHTNHQRMNANYSSRLTETNNNIESVQTSLTALKGQLERNLSSLSSDLQSLKQQHTSYQSTLQHNMSTMESKIFDVQGMSANYSSRLTGTNNNIESIQTTLTAIKGTLQYNMSRMESKISDVQEMSANYSSRLTGTNNNIESIQTTLTALKDIWQHNVSTMETKLSYLQAYISAEKQTCPIESLQFFDILSNSASSIFPRSLSNYYQFNYDGSNGYSISDGGGDMYDGGNMLQVWKENEPPVQVVYNRTYSDHLGNFLMVCKAGHPFVLSMLVLNRDGEYRTYNIKEYGDLGADGSGYYRWNTGSLLVGSYMIHYVLYQVYGAGRPSIIQIYFTVSSPKLGSTGSSSLHYVDSQSNTQHTDNKVYMSGTAHNVYFNYVLTSTNPSYYVATSTIEAILRQTFQNFSA